MPRVHVFTGPTLRPDEVLAVLPTASVHAPVGAGDLLRLELRAGDVVVIVDGFFYSARSVRHKEILDLITRGVCVWGTSSMGALRAAELHMLGMRGEGRIFRLYRAGVLEGDDEVTVLHASAEEGHRPLSEALVTLRLTLRAAVRRGEMRATDAAAVVGAAAALPFGERSHPRLVAVACEAGVGAAAVETLRRLLADARVDVKRLDALACLQRLAREGARVRVAPAVPVTLWLDTWRRAAPRLHGGHAVSDDAVLSACRVAGADYPDLHRDVAVRTVAAWQAQRLMTRRPRALLAEHCARTGIGEGELQRWLRDRGLRRDELRAHLAAEDALAAVALERHGHDGAEAVACVTRALALEVLAEHGLSGAGARRHWESTWLDDAEREGLDDGERVARLVARAFAVPPGVPCRGPILAALKVGGGFASAAERVVAARAVNERLAAEDERFAPRRLSRSRVVGHFLHAWGDPDRLDLHLLDRGMRSADDLYREGRELYAHARIAGASPLVLLGTPVAVNEPVTAPSRTAQPDVRRLDDRHHIGGRAGGADR